MSRKLGASPATRSCCVADLRFSVLPGDASESNLPSLTSPAAVVATTVFLVGGDEQTVMLELLVLLGILIISLLLQARTR